MKEKPTTPQAYNDKKFLLPDSEKSCAMYHAIVIPEELRWKLSIHDCHTGIRLLGKLETYADYVEAIDKLHALSKGIELLKMHLVNERFNKLENDK